jgi:hypothetical protein
VQVQSLLAIWLLDKENKMNRISIQLSTGKIIEMQMGGDTDDKELADYRLNTLKQNAINGGLAESDIEVKWVTEQDYADLMESQKEPSTYYELRKLAYPPISEQLDYIFHNGLDVWKQQIQAIKDKYPKD